MFLHLIFLLSPVPGMNETNLNKNMEIKDNKCSVNGMGLSLSPNFLSFSSLKSFPNSEKLYS